MSWNDFIAWLRERGIMRLVPGLFANADDFEVWLDDGDGLPQLLTDDKNNLVDKPLFCVAAADDADHLQLLVVEAYDPDIGFPRGGVDYRTWNEVTIECLSPNKIRMTIGPVNWGETGELAAWMHRKGLTLEQLSIL